MKSILITPLLLFAIVANAEQWWKVTDPTGTQKWYYSINSKELKITPQIPGMWQVESTVCYDHEDDNGERYCTTTAKEFEVLDGIARLDFEDGTTDDWTCDTDSDAQKW
jgi:hypothetical protein